MDLFSGLKSFFKTNASVIDNSIFRLHYKVTGVILIAFSILVTGRQYIGDPIDCTTKKDDGISEAMMDTFCWVHTTFSLPKSWHEEVGSHVIYPGVGNYRQGDAKVYHAYYQWVCFVLFLQAILFYIPRYFWKAMEGGKIKNIVLELSSPILPEETKTKNRTLLVEYLVSNLNNNNFYFICFTLAEILNFVNVVGQIFLMDTFLGGLFLKYGIRAVEFTEWDWSVRYDPMIEVFPRLTKCDFYKFGSGGSVEHFKELCVLPINIINEKIYVFLWFWFVILSVLSGLVLVYRLLIIVWPKSRLMVSRSRARLANQEYVDAICQKCSLGDWFVLHLLSKNLDPLNFKDVVADFARRLEEKNFHHYA